MIFECSAIILTILLLSFMLAREGGKTGWSAAVLPLVIVPSVHICGVWLGGIIGGFLGIYPSTARIGLDLIALVATCLMIGAISLQIKRRKKRVAYLVTCGGYSAILTCVLIVRSIII